MDLAQEFLSAHNEPDTAQTHTHTHRLTLKGHVSHIHPYTGGQELTNKASFPPEHAGQMKRTCFRSSA